MDDLGVSILRWDPPIYSPILLTDLDSFIPQSDCHLIHHHSHRKPVLLVSAAVVRTSGLSVFRSTRSSVSTPPNRRRPYPSSSKSSPSNHGRNPLLLELPAPLSRPHRSPPLRHPFLCRPQRPLPAPGRPLPPAVPPPLAFRVPLHLRLSRLQRNIGRWISTGLRIQGA